MPLLWAAMAGAVSVAEFFGRPFVGLAVAVVGGAVGYASAITEGRSTLADVMISLGLTAIIYAVLRYLGSRARG